MKLLTFCRTIALISAFLSSPSYGISAEKCSRGECAKEPHLDEDYSILVFVSFSMPKPSFLSFAAELERYGGALVIRGLPNDSFADFSQELETLKKRGMDASILIDPDSFEEYGIDRVPSIVLRGDEGFDKITGNVPISYALETFAQKGEIRALAKELKSIALAPSNSGKQKMQNKHCTHSSSSVEDSFPLPLSRGGFQ